MFPNSFWLVSYFPNQYWEKNGVGSAPAPTGAGGQIVAERYRKYMRALFFEQQQRTLIGELTKIRKGKPVFEALNHLQVRAEDANRKAVQRAAIYSAILGVV